MANAKPTTSPRARNGACPSIDMLRALIARSVAGKPASANDAAVRAHIAGARERPGCVSCRAQLERLAAAQLRKTPPVERESVERVTIGPRTIRSGSNRASRVADSIIGGLMLADLSSDDSAKEYLAAVEQLEDTRRPTLEELRMARALCESIERAILFGDASDWKQIGDAYAAVDTMNRQLVVGAVTEAIDRMATIRNVPPDECLPGDCEDYELAMAASASQAHAVLLVADPRFASLSPSDVRAELDAARRGTKTREGRWRGGDTYRWINGVAAQLSCRCGAFGDSNVPEATHRFRTAAKRAPGM